MLVVTTNYCPVIVLMLASAAVTRALRVGVLHRPALCGRRAIYAAAGPHASALLTLTFEQLTQAMAGSGKATFIWKQLRNGLDPFSSGSPLSESAKSLLRTQLGGHGLVPADISSESVASCGTRKMLMKLTDGQSIETVIIPSQRDNYSTLCISTQLGCDRRCAFCATGTMGLLRNLSGSEIIAQVLRAIQIARREGMPKITNVVLMGMGDSAGNMNAVREAVECLTDEKRLQFSSSKICVSTVGPNPECFMQLAAMPGSLAWSLHSPDDAVRKLLVPSTRHTTEELRDSFIRALLTRSVAPPHRRAVLVAFTLIAGVNDHLSHADKIVEFMQPLKEVSSKLVINLIPYNDIQQAEGINVARISPTALGFRKPTNEAVHAFQMRLREGGLFASVRTTRGEEEAAACGMLATRRERRGGSGAVSNSSDTGKTGGASNSGTESERITAETGGIEAGCGIKTVCA
jgi:23S rRNA (adenine2503-C2)-methyltransferase